MSSDSDHAERQWRVNIFNLIGNASRHEWTSCRSARASERSNLMPEFARHPKDIRNIAFDSNCGLWEGYRRTRAATRQLSQRGRERIDAASRRDTCCVAKCRLPPARENVSSPEKERERESCQLRIEIWDILQRSPLRIVRDADEQSGHCLCEDSRLEIARATTWGEPRLSLWIAIALAIACRRATLCGHAAWARRMLRCKFPQGGNRRGDRTDAHALVVLVVVVVGK